MMSLTDDHPHDIGDNEVPTVFMGEYGEESDTDRSSEIDGDETGFAAQLRKQRKQVLEKDAMANGFASDLRKHREQFNLVNVDDEAEDVTGNTFDDVGYFDGHNSTLAASAGDGMNGTAPGEVHSELTDGIFEKGRNNNHICSGSLKSELRINEDGVDDGLREFDTTSPSLPERPINEIDDEDHFGDFDKAQIQIASPEENDGGHQIETPTHFEPKADENMDTENDIAFPPGVIDMGNDANEVAESKILTSGEHNVQSTLEQIETGNENDYNNNIIEEIDAALLEPEPSSIESQDSGDDFRDLNAGSLQYELPNQAANEDGHDDACFHDLDAALSQLDESNTENQAIISDNYDSEGLDAISSKPQTPKDENECIHDNVEDLDAGPSDFEPSNIEIQATDDDFGEFDADLTQDEQLNVESQASHGANDGAFGDFGAAPAQPEPSTVEKQADDDFGEFDAALPQSEPSEVKNEASNDDDDGFGDFDAAPTQPEPSTVEKQSDDGFGDFDSARTQSGTLDTNQADDDGFRGSPQAEASNIQNQGDIDDDDNFGDFDSAPKNVELSGHGDQANDGCDDDGFRDFNATSPNAEISNDGNESHNDDRDNTFGDFGVVTSQTEASTVEQLADDDDNDAFGDFGAAPSQPEPLTTDNQCDNDEEDDAFGDFGAAPSQTEPFTVEKQTDDDDNDAFGDFGAAPSQPEPLTTDDQCDNDEEDDAFGDFGAAPSQPESLTTDNQGDNDDEDDAFGDFGAAPSQPEPSTIENQGDNDDNDAFGDFGAAPSQPELSTIENQGGNDDNDDDFGDFDAAPMSIEPSDHVNAAIIGDNDDAFGNFGAATVEPSTIANEGDDDDDFGDFGAAPTQTNNGNGEKCDDDFGDFDAAPPLESNAPSVDGETFSDFATVPPKSKDASTISNDFGKFDTPPEILTPMAPIGRISDRARNIFAKMQTLHAFSDEDRESTHDNEYIGKGSLSTFLASINSRQEAEDSREENDLDQLLAGAPTSAEDSCSPLVANEDGGGPYGCFIYPSTGLHAPRNQFQDEKLLRRKSSIRKIPDVLPIRLPVGKESPLDTASPAYECDGKKGSTELFQLAKLEVSGGAEDSSEKIQRFQLKIPDLSFMLQSRLQLPTS